MSDVKELKNMESKLNIAVKKIEAGLKIIAEVIGEDEPEESEDESKEND